MKAIVVTDQTAGTAGMKLVERPEPPGAALSSLSGANYGDVVVQVHASGFTGDELGWPSTWIDRLGRDGTPSIPGHELAGVVTASPSAMERRGCRWGSGCSASLTGLATARWRSM
jgi:NADPH:quinone reductase-like Zn-dependent oxidoreductase